MDFEASKREMERRTLEEYEALSSRPHLELELDAQDAYVLLLALQRAYHHSRGETRELAERIGRGIQRAYLEEGSLLALMAEYSWKHEGVRPVITTTLRVPDPFKEAFNEET